MNATRRPERPTEAAALSEGLLRDACCLAARAVGLPNQTPEWTMLIQLASMASTTESLTGVGVFARWAFFVIAYS
jgi:hypothetical protein